MTEIRKDNDAADAAPKPKTDTGSAHSPSKKQDAENYDEAKDGDKSLPVDDMNSANDE